MYDEPATMDESCLDEVTKNIVAAGTSNGHWSVELARWAAEKDLDAMLHLDPTQVAGMMVCLSPHSHCHYRMRLISWFVHLGLVFACYSVAGQRYRSHVDAGP